MTDCQFNTDGPPWTCQQCDWTYARKGEPILSDKPPHRNCPKSPDIMEAADRLGITGNAIKHWAQALARWTVAGFPKRSQAEVERCLRICVHCPTDNYVPDNPKCTGEACRMKTGGRCKLCGCRVSKGRIAVINKILMATEDCPKRHWQILSDIQPSPESVDGSHVT